MSPRAKMEYLETIYLRYKKASVKEKTLILNEFCLNCGYHRKHAIRLLNHFKRFTKPKPNKRGKPSTYNQPSVLEPLKKIWLAANLPCSKRLKVILRLWLPAYVKEFGSLSLEVVKALLRVRTSGTYLSYLKNFSLGMYWVWRTDRGRKTVNYLITD